MSHAVKYRMKVKDAYMIGHCVMATKTETDSVSYLDTILLPLYDPSPPVRTTLNFTTFGP
jgi:hypothetical protein